MKCNDVMTRNPVCCDSNETVDKVAQMMQREDVGSIPVVDSSKRLIGIVTDRDLAMNVVARSLSPKETRVLDVMTLSPIACYPDNELDDVLSVMSEHQIRRIPVITNEGTIIGIIAQADIALRTPNERKTGEMVEEISKPTA